jgi:UDP-N-acetylmuramyl pentapeptide phosphotransferase/UDP-N-acetylglucosamine-1-phosphate transferase
MAAGRSVSAGWVATIAPAAIAFAVIAILRASPWSARLADHPNARSLHADPTPRIGGLGILAGVIPIAAPHVQGPLVAISMCALALALVSLADDLRSLPIEVRLPAHATAALMAVLAMSQPGISLPWGWAGAALAIAAIAWSTNLFNFMDGSDGLAGGMAAIGFAGLAYAAWGVEQPTALVCAATASASIGFLAHNFPPARVFLGDCGSIPLGFLAGAIGTFGVASSMWPAWFPLLVFSPFVVDATVTLALRAARGERFWVAHREHAYQRLVLRGWSRRRLALCAYGLMACACTSAVLALREEAKLQCAILFVWVAIYSLLAVAVYKRTRRKA